MKNYLKIGITGLLIVATLVFFNQAWASTLIASYTQTSNSSGTIGTGGGSGTDFSNSSSITLDSAKFYLSNSFSNTGKIQVAIYNLSGTYGSGAVPTGSPLAISDDIDIASFTSFSFITFTFSGSNRITLSPSTNYGLAVIPDGSLSGSINIGYVTSPTYSGDFYSLSSGTWYTSSIGRPFYVYGVSGGTPVVVSGSGQKMLSAMAF